SIPSAMFRCGRSRTIRTRRTLGRTHVRRTPTHQPRTVRPRYKPPSQKRHPQGRNTGGVLGWKTLTSQKTASARNSMGTPSWAVRRSPWLGRSRSASHRRGAAGKSSTKFAMRGAWSPEWVLLGGFAEARGVLDIVDEGLRALGRQRLEIVDA